MDRQQLINSDKPQNTRAILLGLYLGISSLILLGLGVAYSLSDNNTKTSSLYDDEASQYQSNPKTTLSNYYNANYIDDSNILELDYKKSLEFLNEWTDSRNLIDNSPESIFTRILKGKEEGTILYQDNLIAAIKAKPAAAPVHIKIFPKRQVSSLSNLLAKLDNMVYPYQILLGRLLAIATQLAKKYDTEDNGYRIVINNGENAGQVVKHLHIDVFAGHKMNWPPWPLNDKENSLYSDNMSTNNNLDVDYVDIPDERNENGEIEVVSKEDQVLVDPTHLENMHVRENDQRVLNGESEDSEDHTEDDRNIQNKNEHIADLKDDQDNLEDEMIKQIIKLDELDALDLNLEPNNKNRKTYKNSRSIDDLTDLAMMLDEI